ncbi:hypothetical protein [Rhodovulum sulfidophilum]|uniref:Uncharacterized protein n=1 Tax=Rhodovulum sulfidophilum TaxID=35806 RepID=A0ABS1RSW7_RHOSU|nr:hypothetical protein [Rhodovulum sulfidophilum]MBL3609160.1 hypothetical protein [Rhodovulum sulfidophilum]MCE8457322.1 hypothetical protein [Rhodovulum sulfidophilum]
MTRHDLACGPQFSGGLAAERPVEVARETLQRNIAGAGGRRVDDGAAETGGMLPSLFCQLQPVVEARVRPKAVLDVALSFDRSGKGCEQVREVARDGRMTGE